MPRSSNTRRALRIGAVAPILVVLSACFATPPTAPPAPDAVWHAECPIDATAVSTIVGVPMRQTTPDGETPWCQFQAADDAGVLVVNLDDRPSVWGRTLPEARRENAEEASPNCTQAGAPDLGADAFTYACAPDEDYAFYTATALFEMDGSVKHVGINKNQRRLQPTDLSGLAVAVARRVLG